MINTIILAFSFGPWEIIIIAAVVLLLFGGKKIPQLMKGLGQGIKEFKNASKGETEENEIESKKEPEEKLEKE